MARTIRWAIVSLVALAAAYLLTWPVPVDPVAWTAPPDPGFTGKYQLNERLADMEGLPLGRFHGPEDIAIDASGFLYAASHEGWIVRLDPDGGNPKGWAETGGRPLGIDFAPNGDLVVADAYRGLLAVSPDGTVRELATEADGIPIRYADDVDTAADGRIYFSDASTRFGALEHGGTLPASLLELLEHRSSGRLLVYDPVTGAATTVLDGLSFANGVAVSPDQQFVLVNETGEYRVLKVWIDGPRRGEHEVLIGPLPGFPDNISTGLGGRFWLALVSPRNSLLDRLAPHPFLRKMIQRLPEAVRPAAVSHGHLVAIDAEGRVLVDLQDPSGGHPLITGAVESDENLFVGSLVADRIGRLPAHAWRQ